MIVPHKFKKYHLFVEEKKSEYYSLSHVWLFETPWKL